MCDLKDTSPSEKYRRINIVEPCDDNRIFRCRYWPDYQHYHASQHLGCHDGFVYRDNDTCEHRKPLWQLSIPPQDHDVFLPASMLGQYKLYLPTETWSGKPLYWMYYHWHDLPQHYLVHHSDVVGTIDVPLSGTNIPQMQRIIGYREPVYLPTFGLSPNITHQQKQASCTPVRGGASEGLYEFEGSRPASSKQIPRDEECNKWSVFHSADNELPSRTVIFIGDIMLEIKPQAAVEITETTPNAWFSMSTHKHAAVLGSANLLFSNCFLAYSETAPKTHLLIGNYSVHIGPAVALKLTQAAAGQGINGSEKATCGIS